MEKIKNNFLSMGLNIDFAVNLSVAILIFIVSLFLMSSLGFLFKLSITPFYMVFSFLLSVLFLKKKSVNYKSFLFIVSVFVLIFACFFILSLTIYDNSWDGRSSHYAEMILLKNGWNPIFDDYKEFCKNYHVYEASAFWGNSYMRFFEVVGANFYKYFTLIETTKMTNFFMFFACFLYSFSAIKTFLKKSNVLPLILSLLIIINPVVISQLFNNYIDANLYLVFALMLFAILKNPSFDTNKKDDCLVFLISALILSTCKFSAIAYCFVICFLYLLFLIIKKKNVTNYLIATTIVLLLFLLCTISPLYTNFKNFKHPFYPIMGENKINIFIPNNYPSQFKGKSLLYKYFLSTISESLNTVEEPKEMDARLKPKIPFTVSIESKNNIFTCPDMRICGFGYFWSGILCLNILLFCFLRFRNKNDKQLFFLFLGMILVSTFLNPECWYARYAPQQWLLPVFSIIFALRMKTDKTNIKILKNILLVLMIFVILFNSFIIAYQIGAKTIEDTKYFKAKYRNIKNFSPNGIYVSRVPAWENMVIADESTLPHLTEMIDNVVLVDLDDLINSKEKYYQVHHELFLYRPTYFFKPINEKLNF